MAGKQAGRPRLASVDTAVLSSARSILAGRGYGGMSVEEVAVLAGVSKPTIYRRYPSKRDLARAAVEGLSDDPDRITLPASGALDVRRCLDRFEKECKRINAVGLMAAALLERDQLPDLLDAMTANFIMPWSSAIRRVIGASEDRDADATVRIALGGFFAAEIVGGRPRQWLGYAQVLLEREARRGPRNR
jgi:AcrR family transcriptional regulator